MILVLIASVLLVGCHPPTSPTSGRETENGASLYAYCYGDGSTELRCLAQMRGNFATGILDVSRRVEWSVSDPAVAKQGTEPSAFIAVAPGDAFVSAHDSSQSGQTFRQPITVFPGTQPLPTFPISGRVRDGGVAIRGAVVQITGGYVSGRTAVMGQPSAPPPGFELVSRNFDGYVLFGIPPGMYEATARAEGYAPQSRTVNVGSSGGNELNFDLTPTRPFGVPN